MKNFFIVLFLLLLTIPSNASIYYLIDVNGNVVAKQDGPAKTENLIKDNFIQIKSDNDIDLRVAEVRNGKIVVHTPTQSEIADQTSKSSNRASAIAKFKAIGLTDNEIKAILP